MNRSVILLIALIFINNCSLNENSRIWKDKDKDKDKIKTEDKRYMIKDNEKK